MNNNDFDKWINKKNKASDATYRLIDKMSKPKNKGVLWLKWGLTGFASVFLSFAILINASTSFYLFALGTPLKDVATLLRMIKDNESITRIADIIDKEQYQKMDTKFTYKSETRGEVNATILGAIYDSNSVTLIIEDTKVGKGSNEVESLFTMKIDNNKQVNRAFWNIKGGYHFLQFVFDAEISAGQVFELLYDDGLKLCSEVIEKEYIEDSKVVSINEVLGEGDEKVLIKSIVVGRWSAIINYEDMSMNYKLGFIEFKKTSGNEDNSAGCSNGKCVYRFEGLDSEADVSLEFENLIMTANKKVKIRYDLNDNKWLNIPASWETETILSSDGTGDIEYFYSKDKGTVGYFAWFEMTNEIPGVKVSEYHTWDNIDGKKVLLFGAHVENPKEQVGIVEIEATVHEYVKVNFSKDIK